MYIHITNTCNTYYIYMYTQPFMYTKLLYLLLANKVLTNNWSIIEIKLVGSSPYKFNSSVKMSLIYGVVRISPYTY